MSACHLQDLGFRLLRFGWTNGSKRPAGAYLFIRVWVVAFYVLDGVSTARGGFVRGHACLTQGKRGTGYFLLETVVLWRRGFRGGFWTWSTLPLAASRLLDEKYGIMMLSNWLPQYRADAPCELLFAGAGG